LLHCLWLHPVDKLARGDYLDEGETESRHMRAVGIEHVGKRSHR
jgi:hypothetical protein